MNHAITALVSSTGSVVLLGDDQRTAPVVAWAAVTTDSGSTVHPVFVHDGGLYTRPEFEELHPDITVTVSAL